MSKSASATLPPVIAAPNALATLRSRSPRSLPSPSMFLPPPRALMAASLGLSLLACKADESTAVARNASTPPVERPGAALPPEALPGGATTFVDLNPLSPQHRDALSQPAANLDSAQRRLFAVGNSFFTQPWVSAGASTAGRDGLGPLFSAAACQDCHLRDGRGLVPSGPEQPITSAVLRLARPDGSADPVYGPHLQTRSLPGLAPEAEVRVHWEAHRETLPDGTAVELRRPRLQVSAWGYGPPAAGLKLGLRVAPAMTGLGLLEAIPAAAIQAYAEAQREQGLHGIVQEAVVLEGEPAGIGRFGWKARQASVRQQSLDAFINDLGITSSLFPEENCTPAQRRRGCADFASGGEPELSTRIEAALVFYAGHLAPPVRRGVEEPLVREGQRRFAEIGCAGCHKPDWQTAGPPGAPTANQRIWPYSDLLLHDLGEGLADGIAEGRASGRHWRTAPLWGLSQVKAVGGEAAGYLHDGRARSLPEAILWHGGEAQAARDAWAALPASQRHQVLAFLQSL